VKEFVDAVELGKMLNLSVQMVNFYRRKGVLKGFRVGKHYRFDGDEEIARLKKGQNN